MTGFNQDVYTLGTEGRVILQWPEKMSQDSYDELEDWITLQLKKIARINGLKSGVISITKTSAPIGGLLASKSSIDKS